MDENFRASRFTIDSIPDAVFNGYENGEDRNGWACPYFEQEEAEHVLRLSEPNGFQWRYDATEDAYVVTDPPSAMTPPNVIVPSQFSQRTAPQSCIRSAPIHGSWNSMSKK